MNLDLSIILILLTCLHYLFLVLPTCSHCLQSTSLQSDRCHETDAYVFVAYFSS